MSNKYKMIKDESRRSKIPPAEPATEKETRPERSSRLGILLKPHVQFALLAFVFGSLFIITTPPFQIPDEKGHFARAFILAEFNTFQRIENNHSGDDLPVSIDSALGLFRYLNWKPDEKVEKKQILDAFTIPLDQQKRQFSIIDGGSYFYFSYIPQFPAIYLGKLFDLNVLTILYLGRFFGLLFYIICVWYAIKIIPIAKYLLTVIALTPMCLAQAGSSNPDCVLFSFSFLSLAILLNISFIDKKLKIDKDTILLFLILLIIGVLKVVNVPMALLIFLLPRTIFKNKLSYFTTTLTLIFLSATVALIWFKLNPLGSFHDPFADADNKIKSLLNNPFVSFKILGHTINKNYLYYYQTVIGVLGYLDTVLNKGVYIAYGFLIIFITLFEIARFKLLRIHRILLVCIAFSVFAGVILSLYFVNHRDNGFLVTLVQGRYFIPVLFPFFLAFTGLSKFNIDFSKNKIAAILVFLILIGALLSTQLTLCERYFGM